MSDPSPPESSEPLTAEQAVARAVAAYEHRGYFTRPCDHCGRKYQGPAIYCSLTCALADA